MYERKVLLILISLCFCPAAQAHRPVFSKQKATSFDDAVLIVDPGVSQVVYRELTERTPQVWLRLDAEAGSALFVQIGIPALARQKAFRPSMAVVGPGLPANRCALELPTNAGIKIFRTNGVDDPRFFHEHFTGTDSWILRSETVTLPKTGRYYVVAYAPDRALGKLWLSIGRKEAFTAADIARFPDWRRRIRAFHEVRPGVFEMGTEPLKALLGLSTSAETSKTPNKITSLIDSEESISVFRSALEATDLRRMLEGDGPFTVFAPTDQALSQLPNSDDLLKPEAKEQLALLLKAHIVSERIYLHGRRTESLSDLPLLLHTNGPTLVNDALVLKANMVASNGIVHVIDRVLDPDASSDASRRQMRRMIETAISFGVPLFNSGNFGECVSIYRTTLLNIEEFVANKAGKSVRKTIFESMKKADAEEDMSAKAWILRYALDEIYGQLKPRTVEADAPKTDLLIDDFSDSTPLARIGSRWRLITDRVMGGVSDGEFGFGKDGRFSYMCLTGNVSLENNGGFIQVALELDNRNKWFNADGYRGIRLWVKGNGKDYYVHLRSRETRLPWQYYSAAFETSEEWTKVELSFDDFKGQNLRAELNTRSLSRMAIVAAKRAFQADVCVGRIEFYK
ncbi:MAG: CIA30 family protein [Planctomycetota bacterium]|jgi:uncharacterized surface protein with fasciclin (FAS1) repeats